MTTAVSAHDLEVRYGTTVALSGVGLEVPCGSSVAVTGANGSGKSTLLGALAGTVAISAGRIHVDGPNPALVQQSTDIDTLLPLTVGDTVALARYASLGLIRRFRAADREAVQRAMSRLEIADLADRQLHELSGGQRQRTLLAQGLAQHTGVLLLDEPFTGLDARSRSVVTHVLDEELASGRAIVMSTHDLADAQRCDQVLTLDRSPTAGVHTVHRR